jgi:hypothetical protein
MPVLNWRVLRRDCKVLLESKGNRDRRNAKDLGLRLRQRQLHFSLVVPPPAVKLRLTIPSNRCHKIFKYLHSKEMIQTLIYQKITVQLTNVLQLFYPVFLPKISKGSLSGPNHVIQFLFLCVNLATLSIPGFFCTECLALRFGEEL